MSWIKNLLLSALLIPLPIFAQKMDNEYGVNAHFMWEYREIPRELEMLDAANIRFVRTDLCWNFQERKPGEWNFERYDAAMKLAAEKNITVLPILSYAPKWKTPAHKNMPEWLDYVQRNLRRYGSNIKYWEIWNEHNYDVFWPKPDPLDYLSLLKPTYELIRKEAPQAKVILGGTSQIPLPYLETLLKAGAGNYFDVMNVHPYNWYEAPEVSLRKQLLDLRKLMDKYKVDKDIWITEIGWPTHQTAYHQEVLPTALRVAGVDPQGLCMAVVNDNGLPILASSPGLDWAKIFPQAKEIKSITLAELKTLDPKRYPVLVPTPAEYFSGRYFNDLELYVRNGGVVIFPRGVPFYTGMDKAADGAANKTWIDQSLRKKLHIAYDAWWLDKSKPMPRNFNAVPAPELANGITTKKLFGANAVMTDKELKGNDKMIPVIQGKNGDFTGCLMAVYKFDSDLKGAVIAGTVNWTGQAPVDEDTQARYLPRTILIAFHAGVKKLCWYEFQSMEGKHDDQEHHFGLTHKDLSPKPAFHAYATLAKMRPSGSSIPRITISPQGVYLAKWEKRGGGNGWAVWVPGTAMETTVKITGSLKGACDYLGAPVKIPLRDNQAKITVSGGITYLDGPDEVTIL